jgi:hypothetical protein
LQPREALDEVVGTRILSRRLPGLCLVRVAELKLPNKSMKSISGLSKDDEVERYTEAANQERLAELAIGRLAAWEMSNLDPELDTESA